MIGVVRRGLAPLLLVLVIALLAACGGSDGSATEANGGTPDAAADESTEAMSAAMVAGDCQRALELGEAVISADEDPGSVLMARIVAVNCELMTGDVAAAQTQIEGIRTSSIDGQAIGPAMAAYFEALAATQSGDYATAVEKSGTAVALAEDLGIPRLQVMALIGRAWAASNSGDCATAEADATRAIGLAEESGGSTFATDAGNIIARSLGLSTEGGQSDLRSTVRGYMIRASCAGYGGDGARALVDAEKAVEIARSSGEKMLLFEATTGLAEAAFFADRCPQAVTAARDAVAMAKGMPESGIADYLMSALGTTAVCAPRKAAIEAGAQALALGVRTKAVNPARELVGATYYVNALFTHEMFGKACAVIADHPDALLQEAYLDTPDYASYRLLAAECPILGFDDAVSVEDARTLIGQYMATVERANDQESLGFGYYVRALIEDQLGNADAARRDLERAAELGDENALAILNG